MIKKIFGSTQSMLIYIISCLVVVIAGYYRGVGWSGFEIISVPFLGLMIWGAIMVVLRKVQGTWQQNAPYDITLNNV